MSDIDTQEPPCQPPFEPWLTEPYEYREDAVRDTLAVLERWDGGSHIRSVELGGVGPGHEQATQVMAVEIARAILDKRPSHEREAVVVAGAAARETGLEPSNLMFDAAFFFALRAALAGWERHVAELIRDPRGRVITVTRDFPQAPARGEAVLRMVQDRKAREADS